MAMGSSLKVGLFNESIDLLFQSSMLANEGDSSVDVGIICLFGRVIAEKSNSKPKCAKTREDGNYCEKTQIIIRITTLSQIMKLYR